jgi:hypothetical protein
VSTQSNLAALPAVSARLSRPSCLSLASTVTRSLHVDTCSRIGPTSSLQARPCFKVCVKSPLRIDAGARTTGERATSSLCQAVKRDGLPRMNNLSHTGYLSRSASLLADVAIRLRARAGMLLAVERGGPMSKGLPTALGEVKDLMLRRHWSSFTAQCTLCACRTVHAAQRSLVIQCSQ